MPILQRSVGNDIRTYSAYANDTWRYNNRLSFNLGVRFDLNRSKDQSGTSVVRDSQWSPRLGVTWDIRGDGRWLANVGFARYVAAISTALVDAGSAGGRQASYSWFYQGPDVNTGSGPYLTADQALPILWDWFFANGGNNRADANDAEHSRLEHESERRRHIAERQRDLASGVANQIRQRRMAARLRASERFGHVRRLPRPDDRPRHRFHGPSVRPHAGQQHAEGEAHVQRPDGRRPLSLASAAVGGNYTLSKTWGNFNGENVGSGPIRATFDTFPEYRQESWNYPMGYNPGDQRHKMRAWFNYTVPVSPGHRPCRYCHGAAR